MLKFMLISISERDVAPPQFFDSLDAARTRMEAELLEQICSYVITLKGKIMKYPSIPHVLILTATRIG